MSFDFEDVKETEEDFEDKMSEVERRLEVASYYRLLLNDSLFQDQTEASVRVETEIRDFIRQRLSVLLGVGSEKNPSDFAEFTDEELTTLKDLASIGAEGVQAIKAIAGKVTQKPQLLAPRAPPKLRVVKAEPPKLKKTIKTEPPKPAQKQSSAPTKKTKLKLPDAIQNDPTLKIENGRALVQVKNADGEPMWELDKATGEKRPLMRDATPQAQSTTIKPLPMPPPAQFAATMHDLASRDVRMNEQTDQMFANVVLGE